MSHERDRSLSYERPAGGISRWQFRLLLFLLIANSPSPSRPPTRRSWRRRCASGATSRRSGNCALQAQASNWTEPPGKVVWDDTRRRRSHCSAGAATSASAPHSPSPRAITRSSPAGRPAPPRPRRRWGRSSCPPSRSTWGVASTRGTRARSFSSTGFAARPGTERLVYVLVSGQTDLSHNRPPAGDGGRTAPRPHRRRSPGA